MYFVVLVSAGNKNFEAVSKKNTLGLFENPSPIVFIDNIFGKKLSWKTNTHGPWKMI